MVMSATFNLKQKKYEEKILQFLREKKKRVLVIIEAMIEVIKQIFFQFYYFLKNDVGASFAFVLAPSHRFKKRKNIFFESRSNRVD